MIRRILGLNGWQDCAVSPSEEDGTTDHLPQLVSQSFQQVNTLEIPRLLKPILQPLKPRGVLHVEMNVGNDALDATAVASEVLVFAVQSKVVPASHEVVAVHRHHHTVHQAFCDAVALPALPDEHFKLCCVAIHIFNVIVILGEGEADNVLFVH